MGATIFRYPLPIEGIVKLDLPQGAKVLSIGPPRADPEVLDLWAEVKPGRPRELRTFHVYGTGHPLADDRGTYVGTTPSHDGRFIWHVYDATPERW